MWSPATDPADDPRAHGAAAKAWSRRPPRPAGTRHGNGSFGVTNNPVSICPGWATAPGVTITGTPIPALF